MLAALLGTVIAFTPARHAAQEPLCRPHPVRQATRSERYQQIRAARGFRHDRAYAAG